MQRLLLQTDFSWAKVGTKLVSWQKLQQTLKPNALDNELLSAVYTRPGSQDKLYKIQVDSD